jgi:gastrin-releasing peptide receptor
VVAVLAADLCGSDYNKTHDYNNTVSESDCVNKTRDSDWNSVEQFLQTGNVTKGELAVNWTQNYMHCLLRKARENIMPENNSLLFGSRNRELSCAINEVRIIKEIFELAKMDIRVKTYSEEEQNLLTQTHKEQGKEEIKSVQELILLLNESLAKYELMLDKVRYVHYLMQFCMRYSLNVSWICVLISEQQWNTLIRNKTDRLKYYQDAREELENEMFFGSYVNPAVYGVILLVGLLGNGTVLLTFTLVKEVRTKSSVMIFNLVIGDTLNLLVNIPLYYMVRYSTLLGPLIGLRCHLYAMIRFVFFAVSALSVVSLSIQRYVITTHVLWRPRILGNVFLYLVTVWFLAILVSLPDAFTVMYVEGKCSSYSQFRNKIASLLNFLFYCVVCPSVMAAFSVLTARRLRKSIQDVPSQLCNNNMETSRNRSAKVLRALALAFLISYVPIFTWNFVYCWFGDVYLELPGIVSASIDHVTYHLLFLNVCLNPVALYAVSSTFRKPFVKYAFHCCNTARRKRQISNNRVSVQTNFSEVITEVPERNTSFLDLRVRTGCD